MVEKGELSLSFRPVAPELKNEACNVNEAQMLKSGWGFSRTGLGIIALGQWSLTMFLVIYRNAGSHPNQNFPHLIVLICR